MSSRPLRVAIVGGGVCGLTCAVGLQRRGVDVQVYEAAAKFGEIGAGLGLGRNAVNVLKALGVYDTLSVDDMRGWFVYHRGTGDHEVLFDGGDKDTLSRGVHRAVFLDALVAHLDPARARFKKRCTHLTEGASGTTTVHFADGTAAEADVVLGADGIKSVVRRFVTDTASRGVDSHVKFSNTICYRSLVPAARAREAGCKFDYGQRPRCMVGENRHLILFTVKGGTLINVVAFVSDPDSAPASYPQPPLASVQQATKAEVLAAYDGWGPEATNLLACMDNPTKWNISVVYPHIPAAHWTRRAVAILGDAAHGMLPHLGAGAGQGLEDAYLLAQLLGHPQTNVSNVEAVLRAYASVREPRARMVWESSRHAGDIWDCRAGYDGIEAEEVKSLLDPVWYHPVDADLLVAEYVLVKEQVFRRPS